MTNDPRKWWGDKPPCEICITHSSTCEPVYGEGEATVYVCARCAERVDIAHRFPRPRRTKGSP